MNSNPSCEGVQLCILFWNNWPAVAGWKIVNLLPTSLRVEDTALAAPRWLFPLEAELSFTREGLWARSRLFNP